jgi:triosephosphate isomerase
VVKTNSKTLIGASWKMNKSVNESITYAKELNEFVLNEINEKEDIEIFFLPTFLPLFSLKGIVNSPKLMYGAQNSGWQDEGAFTGEVSPAHLKDLGCTYIELGHAERRSIFMEDDEMINRKLKAVLNNDLKPILCIGEKEKSKDTKDVFKFLGKQLQAGLKDVPLGDMDKVIIAYEPIWAIGAKYSAPIGYIEDSLAFLRELLKKEFGKNISQKQFIIYGGSVTPESTPDLLELENVNGIFIGRASLDLKYFIEIIKIAMDIVCS